MPGVPSQQSICTIMHLPEEPQIHRRKWYFSRQEIEGCSPSRKDGIDLEKETQLRKLYCSFIQELGKKLKVPQVTIACALMLCHRFYMRQSHAKNDWKTIATASIFLACKLEETPRLLRDVAVLAYEMMYKWDPSAPQRIKKIEFCNKRKELIVTGERLLLVTIAFDLDIQLPYGPLVDALKKLEMDIYPDLAKVAWNFVNDWLCTILCLQYKPHYIAAGSMFLAAKFQKVKLPTERGKVWWLEFDISPKQLEEVVQQMVRLLEHDRKQSLSLKNGNVERCKASAGKMVVSSSQSTITSVSMANSDSSNRDVMDSMASSNRNFHLKEVIACKMSDTGASSIVEDGDGKGQPRTEQSGLSLSCNIVSVHNSFHKMDADRIREALKRRRCNGAANMIPNVAGNTEIDGEAWIERELEIGIEGESAPLEKKQRMLAC